MNISKEETKGRISEEPEVESECEAETDNILEKQLEALENRILTFLEAQADSWVEEECWLRVEAFKSKILVELREEADRWISEELRKRTAEFRKRTEEL